MLAPAIKSASGVLSFGLWLIPPMLGTKIIVAGGDPRDHLCIMAGRPPARNLTSIIGPCNVTTLPTGNSGARLSPRFTITHFQMFPQASSGARWRVEFQLLIENGRVTADVEVDALDTTFVNARVLVQVPVGERQALLVPADAVVTRTGVDFVSVNEGGGTVQRVVITSELISRPDGVWRS